MEGPGGPKHCVTVVQVGAEQSCPPPPTQGLTTMVYRNQDLDQRRKWPPGFWLPLCQTHTRSLEHRECSLSRVVSCLSQLQLLEFTCLLEDYHIYVCAYYVC